MYSSGGCLTADREGMYIYIYIYKGIIRVEPDGFREVGKWFVYMLCMYIFKCK